MPAGFFGTRADLLMDLAITLLTLLPVALWTAVRFARSGRWLAHRNMQVTTLTVVLVVVVLLELDIRLTGGTSRFVALVPDRATLVRMLLLGHITVASLTFIAWLGLVCASWPRFRSALPGAFSRMHRRLGWIVFASACVVSASGALLYALNFVL